MEDLNLPEMPTYSILTVVLADDGSAPKVDLGGISPYLAVGIFESITEILREVLLPPEVTFRGEPIYTIEYDDDEDE